MRKTKDFAIRKLKDIDFLGNKFIFTLDGRDTYSTAFGSFLTILSLFAAGYSLYYFGLQFFDTSSPSIYKEDALDFASAPLNFHLLDYYFTLCVSNGAFFLKSDIEKISTTVLKITDVQIDNPSMTNSSYYFMEDCIKAGLEHYKTIHNSSEAYAAFIEEFSLCIPEMKNDYWVSGSLFNSKHRTMSLSVYPCILDDPSHNCQTPYDHFMLMAYFGVTRSSVDVEDKDVGLLKSFNYETVSALNPASTTIHSYTYKKTTIYDDDLDYTSLKERESFLELESKITYSQSRDAGQLYCTRETIIDGSCLSYFTIYLKPSPRYSKIVRQYPKLMSLLSNAGGLIDVIFWVAVVINRLYQNWDYIGFLKKNMLKKNAKQLQRYFPEKTTEEIDQLLHDIVQKKKDGVDLLDNLYEVDLLSKLYLKNEHRVLVPLLLLKIKECEGKKGVIVDEPGQKIGVTADQEDPHTSLISMIKELQQNDDNQDENLKISELHNNLSEYYLGQTSSLFRYINNEGKCTLNGSASDVDNKNSLKTNTIENSNSRTSNLLFKKTSQASYSGSLLKSRTLKKKQIFARQAH